MNTINNLPERPAPVRAQIRLFHVKQWVSLMILALLFTACVPRGTNPVTGNKRFYGYTWEQEVQIGQESDAAIIQQYGIYNDPQMTTYVDSLGQALLDYSHLRRPDADPKFQNTVFTFRVLDSPVVNAFALPGGYVYVTRGLMAHIENEAQLAVVLGHEIGHVAARHSSKRAATQQFGQLGLIGGAILGQAVLGGNAAQNVLDIGGTAAGLLFLSYGRDDERESDDLGVEYAALAGYEASEGAGFFTTLDRMGQKSGQSLPGWASTHPEPGEREQTIRRHASEWQQKGVPMTKVKRDNLLDKVDNVVLGPDPRQGFTENSVFYHPELQFQFPVPRGFSVINQPTQVVMVDQNQQAILGFTIEQEAQSPQAAAERFAAQEGLTVVERRAAQSGSLPAYYVVADAQTEQGQVRVASYYVAYRGSIYNFIGYSAAANFATYSDAFFATMRGFAPVSDARILNAQPTRIDVTTVRRSASFESLLTGTYPTEWTAEDMAILNQMALNQQVAPGTRIKLAVK